MQGTTKIRRDLHAKDEGRVYGLQTLHLASAGGQKKWSLVHPAHIYQDCSAGWEMRTSSQEMPERKGVPVRTGGPGGRSCEDPGFQRLKHRNGTMEQW